jgi:predicted Zn-dependent peptidase
LTREDILEFTGRTYNADRISIAVLGAFTEERIGRITEEHFGEWALSNTSWNNTFQGKQGPQRKVDQLAQFQDHYMIGWRTAGIHDDKKRPLSLLNNILGGPAMNSRLGLNIREKHGIAYNIESYMNMYSDIGMLGIYLGCDPTQTSRAAQLVLREVEKLQQKKLGTLQLSKAKSQYIGQMALAEENGLTAAIGAARTLLHFDKVNSFEYMVDQIGKLTAEQLMDAANEYLQADLAYELVYKKPN